MYEDKIESGMSPEAAMKAMGCKQEPITGKEFYRQIHKTWVDNGCKTLWDVAFFYLKVHDMFAVTRCFMLIDFSWILHRYWST